MRLSFTPNRRLSPDDFRALQDRPIFVKMLLNRVMVHVGDDDDDAKMNAIYARTVIDEWLMENAVGLFHVKLEEAHTNPRDRRVDVYVSNPEDAFHLKLRLEGTSVRDW